MKNLLLALAIAAVGSGCAAVHPKLEFTRFGEADPEADTAVRKSFTETADLVVPKSEVTVLIDSLPPGVDLKDNTLTTSAESGFRTIGKFGIHKQAFPMLLTFFDYKAGWKKGFCYPQVVLNWITLTIWQIVPTAWPCLPSAGATQTEWIVDMRRAAKAAGANVVIATWIGPAEDSAWGAVGFMLQGDLSQLSPDKMRPQKLNPEKTTMIPEMLQKPADAMASN